MKKITYIILIVAVALASSCKKYLEQKPFLTTSNDLALSDFNGINKAVAGAYGPLASATWYGADMVLTSEMRAENATIPTNSDFTSGRYQLPFKMNYDPDATTGLWGLAYYIISAVNNVLEAIETNGMDSYTGSDVTEDDVNNLIAECYFLRALAHFDCMRTYCHSYSKKDLTIEGKKLGEFGIPVILKTDKTAKEQPKRNTVEEVYAQVIKDLVAAEGLMAPSYKRSGVTDSKAAATLPAIQALLARVYLYSEKWQDAANEASKVIENSAFNLWKESEYASVWGNNIAGEGGEVIFEVYGKSANEYDAYWEGPSHMTNPIGYADVAASSTLTSLFEEGDIRGTKGIRGDDDGKVLFCTDPEEKSGGELWTMKYFGKGDGDATSTPDFSNTIVLRLSEMYLIRAEALANGASVSGATAVKDINEIRAARGASPVTAAGPAVIALERRLELNFEGHYWFDLARTKGSITYADSRRGDNIAADSKYWALPIPLREFKVNSNLVQNPGF